jgi:hypothetical protein
MKKKFTTVDKLDVIDILLSKYGDITLKEAWKIVLAEED